MTTRKAAPAKFYRTVPADTQAEAIETVMDKAARLRWSNLSLAWIEANYRPGFWDVALDGSAPKREV